MFTTIVPTLNALLVLFVHSSSKIEWDLIVLFTNATSMIDVDMYQNCMRI